MELVEDESARTVDCLRGRLLAERLASRNAKDEAQLLQNKMMELENMVKQEAKSRDRAEKKLKLLYEKLDSINNISYVSSDGSRGKSDGDDDNTSENYGSEGQNGNVTENLDQDSVVENFLFPEGDDAYSDKSSPQGSDQSDICYHKFRFPSEDYGLIKGVGRDEEISRVDNTMALVVVRNERQENPNIDPEVLDSAVKEVLDALKLAKEQLQSSMEKRRVNMIRVG